MAHAQAREWPLASQQQQLIAPWNVTMRFTLAAQAASVKDVRGGLRRRS